MIELDKIRPLMGLRRNRLGRVAKQRFVLANVRQWGEGLRQELPERVRMPGAERS